jgi:hypothetical protein
VFSAGLDFDHHLPPCATTSRTRWAKDFANQAWAYGSNGDYLKEWVTYWLEQYDWRTHEAAMNTFSHYTTTIENMASHFMHERGKSPPRKWAESYYHLQRWTVMPAGGHFAPREEPDRLIDDIRAFFRPSRTYDRSAGAIRVAKRGSRRAR